MQNEAICVVMAYDYHFLYHRGWIRQLCEHRDSATPDHRDVVSLRLPRHDASTFFTS